MGLVVARILGYGEGDPLHNPGVASAVFGTADGRQLETLKGASPRKASAAPSPSFRRKPESRFWCGNWVPACAGTTVRKMMDL
ncbi:protein of unknown function [Denitratisoma oestradiolicum]|uniref:Uncharacterized protein n=1 Tax=Denitratisoma oestradiolicum TaxID=311182 RepID=A0A6S6Y0P8_9PROT|nr:protein of unknown function [Denitratisoma oestradiolicum]